MCGGNGLWLSWYQKVWDESIENLSCEREVDNIHNIFAVSYYKGWQTEDRIVAGCPYFSTFFQTSKLVINLCMDP